MGEIQDLNKKIDYNNLTDKSKGENITPTSFINLRGPLNIYKSINGDT